jgi:hypothetical protein
MSGGVALSRATSDVLTDDRGVYRIAQLPPGRYVVGVLSSTTTMPAALAATIDAAAANQVSAFAVIRELLPGGSGIVTNGEGFRADTFVLQRPGPAPPLAPDGSMLSYATTFSPGTPITADATLITVGSGEQRTSVDVPLRLSPTVRVSGVLTGPGGPVKNVAVRLLAPNVADSASFDSAGLATALTDAAGAFTFLAVTPGQYTLKALLADTASPNTPNSVDVSLWAAQPLTVGDSDLTGLAVSMKPGIRVSGRVEFKNLTGAPSLDCPRCVIILRPIGAQSWRSFPGRPAADGTFTTPGDPPGKYLVVSSSEGWILQTVSRDGRSVADDVIDLDATDLAGVVLTFSSKASRVAGSVVDARGAVDAEADVIVFPADTTLWREGIFNDRRVRLTHATSAAAFELAGLAPGEYFIAAVSARLTNDWQDSLFLDRLIAGATKFTLREAEDRTLQLRTFTPRGR